MTDRLRRPNVLLITCDQWRGDCLSAVGHPSVRTPHVDAFARDAVLFRNHFAGAAPCAPARACLYTGLYQMNNRVCRNGTPLDMRHDTLALALRRGGYEPTLFGYTDTAADPRQHAPDDPALTTYEGVLPGFSVRAYLPEDQKPWLSWLASRGHDVAAGSPAIHRPSGFDAQRATSAPPIYASDETETSFMAGEFLRWLGEQDAERPWCAHLSFIRPHPPFVVPEPWNTLHAPGNGPAFHRRASREAEAALHPYIAYWQAHDRMASFLPGADGLVRNWSDDSLATIRAVYYGMIAEVDAQLGRLFTALKSGGWWDDTLIVLTSDHAEMMGDHGLLGKGGFFDQSYHIPLMIRDPRRPSVFGTQVDAFTSAVDVMPTLLDLAGAPAPAWLDGRPLTPFLDGQSPSWREAAFWEFDFRTVSSRRAESWFGLESWQCNLAVVRTETAKYVHFGGGLQPLLFDLAQDPGETRDLSDDPACQTLRREMAERLLEWRAAHLDRSLSMVELTAHGAVGPDPRLTALR